MKFEKLNELNQNELLNTNGGDLVEDIGYTAHAIVDGVYQAADWVAETASDAWDEVTSWF